MVPGRLSFSCSFLLFLLYLGCDQGETSTSPEDATLLPDVSARETAATPDVSDSAELPGPTEVAFELRPDAEAEVPFAECEPGHGCFLDKCSANGDCQSGWCVEHMGQGVCTQTCQEECPQGWKCRQVGASDPDIFFICVSDHANLCKPCSLSGDCKSPGGAADVCIRYGDEGSFCGGTCASDEECPWGFACQQAETVDGVLLAQCVSEAGLCPCTGTSVTRGLNTPCTRSNEFGACAGKRVCTADGLSPCDAPVPAAETCNGLDDDCDEDVDEPAEVGGDYVNLCHDGNDCTVDVCGGAGGCTHEILDSGECMDGDACTVGDHCSAGQCMGNPVLCDDKNPCTDDSCDGLGGCLFANNDADCDDQEPCTVGDECAEGKCLGYALPCACQDDADCLPLEDGDLCNGTLFCDQAELPYKCKVVPGTPVSCAAPSGPGAVCQKAVCQPDTGTCSLAPDHEGYACDDGSLCTVGDHCQAGQCLPGPPANCNDGNPCTDDSCQPGAGCVHPSNQAKCDDGNVCTTLDVCSGGLCMGGPALSCDDGDVCNGSESCHPATGCTPGKALPCDDGDPCNGQETCDPAAGCQSSFLFSCNDGNPCTDDSCQPGSGCVHTPNQAVCDDLNACTLGDHCQAGKCLAASLLVCEDDDPCTTSTCHPESGCVLTLNKAPCDDGNLCTQGDHCHLGSCVGGGAIVCNDGNPCTDDSCAAKVGCQFSPNQAPCDDGNNCTVGDVCKAGWCGFKGFAPCDDGLFCNGQESCHPDKGCAAGPPPVLADGLDCTADVCDEEGDLVTHSPLDALCDDSKFCTGEELCDSVLGCVQGPEVVVSDGVPCTLDQCDEPNDQVLHIPKDGDCMDADACNGIEYCNTVVGCTAGPPLNCNDNVKCTTDSCDPLAGCANAPSDPACDDGNGCTTDTCNKKDGCLYVPKGNGTECSTNGLPGTCTGGTCQPTCQPGSATYNVTAGPQTVVLPACAVAVVIEAWGAEGGKKNSGLGGKGAYMRGTFAGLAQKTLEIRVGEKGADGTCQTCGGGGGGGSFVRVQGANTPLLIAAGAGGASYQAHPGYDGLATQQSGPGGYNSPAVGEGGITDNGGGGGTGAGGGGWLSDGQSNNWATGGQKQGGQGGTTSYSGKGGYGGGGASYHGGGGGGGYSGGSGGTYSVGGGGGGSFNAGTNQTAQAGIRTGNGQVNISW
jgi:hypothetical protein